MTDPITAAVVIGSMFAGNAVGNAFGDDDDKGADGPSGPKAPPPLPVAPTQAKAPGADKTQAEYDVNRARDAERRKAGQRQGQSNTILTGSLGVGGNPSTNRKQLLGA